MKMKKTVQMSLFVGALALASAVFMCGCSGGDDPVDVAGTWKGTLKTTGAIVTSGTTTLNLTQDGDKVIGTMGRGAMSGVVEGDILTLTSTSGSVATSLSGKVDGNHMVLTGKMVSGSLEVQLTVDLTRSADRNLLDITTDDGMDTLLQLIKEKSAKQ